MKVIFIKDVKGHGKKGDVKEVKDGFGQNYLIKNGYAVRETETSTKILEKEIKENEENHSKKLRASLKIKEKLNNLELIFKVKSASNNKIFGSISSKQIAEMLKEHELDIDKKHIHISEPLSNLGVHIVEIELYNKLKTNLKIKIEKEGD